jgi:hypothetical protein
MTEGQPRAEGVRSLKERRRESSMNTHFMFHPRDVLILADAYEIKSWQVVADSTTLQMWCWSGLDLLVHLRNKYDWDVSTAVYYLAALRRALDDCRKSDMSWPAD